MPTEQVVSDLFEKHLKVLNSQSAPHLIADCRARFIESFCRLYFKEVECFVKMEDTPTGYEAFTIRAEIKTSKLWVIYIFPDEPFTWAMVCRLHRELDKIMQQDQAKIG